MNPTFLLLLAVPLAETWLLIRVGEQIGAMPTIALVVLTAIIGTALFQRQGMIVIRRMQLAQQQGQLPAVEMLEGVFLLIAGVLLLTPGFITDTIGFTLLMPGLRHRVAVKSLDGLAQARPDLERPVTLEGEFARKSANDD